MILPQNEFINLLVEKVDNNTTHCFIAKFQASYLKQLKNTIGADEVIVLGDFAENYFFLVQDQIQGYHWNKSQCSLHPVVAYIRSSDNRVESSLCILSEDLNHDVTFVYKVIKETVVFIKKELNPSVKTIHYFSDGCVALNKNWKNFVSLCHHLSEIDRIWNFFATSHGKSLCDGIGGTVKRLTAIASLQRPISLQILSAKTMFELCQGFIHGKIPFTAALMKLILYRVS